jgi:outer membrane receptor protein involved in Fe transport
MSVVSGLRSLVVVAFILPSWGRADAYLLPEDLTELSIDALANIEVTTASRKPQKLSDSAAAIFVITREDIKGSGVTSIPEALRMAPGLEVARIDGNRWADLRLRLKPIQALELSVVGQNLLQNKHKEFDAVDFQRGGTEVPSSFYLKGAWRF